MKAIYTAAVLAFFAAIPASAHDLSETIADCACDSACYTDEVKGLSCTATTFTFQSDFLPDPSQALMVGATATNQNMPRPHSATTTISRTPRLASSITETVPGAIGVAVNGVPIFSPDTQGPAQASGRPVSAADAGELDVCGGHAGRGDDYHYHTAPNCLIEQLGRTAVEVRRQPIGYAADGFPILALGWFDRSVHIEDALDRCRGTTDAAGTYFYNVETSGDLAVLNCFSGTESYRNRDNWTARLDVNGNVLERELAPIPMTITAFANTRVGGQACSVMEGTLSQEQLLSSSGNVERVQNLKGAVFYCSQTCYGGFGEVDASGARGRVLGFKAEVSGCPANFSAVSSNGFMAYRVAN
jgi:hypothetical protein